MLIYQHMSLSYYVFGVETPTVNSAQRIFVSYIDKSRLYYQAQGYDKPYRWATNAEAPFCRPTRPLSTSRVGLVTTAGLHRNDRRDDGSSSPPRRAFSHPTSPGPERMFTDDLSWDKEATHTDDVESFLPIKRLQSFVDDRRIGSLADRFYGVPSEYSHRRGGQDAGTIESWCREDDVDVVLLVPL